MQNNNTGFVFAPIKKDKVFKIVATGEEKKSLMIDLLNCLLPGLDVQDIEYGNKEDPGLSIHDKSCIFDAYCTTESKKQCIIEVQAYDSDTYPDRMITYASNLVRRQTVVKMESIANMPQDARERALKDYSLYPIYVVSILTGKLHHEEDVAEEGKLISPYSVRNDETGEKMNDTLHFVYLEAGRSNVGVEHPEQCRDIIEKLAWSFKYMAEVKERPACFGEELLKKLFMYSKIANMTVDQQELVYKEIEEELKLNSILLTAKRKEREKGIGEGMAKIIAPLIASGMSAKEISERTKISEEDIQKLATN